MTRRRSLVLQLIACLLFFVVIVPVDTTLPATRAVYAQTGDDGVRPLDGGGDDGGGDGGVVETIKKTITNITRIVIPVRTMFDALNQVLARAAAGQLNDTAGAFGRLAGAATGMIQEQLFPTEALADISNSTLPLAAALAVPLFLLRLAIYHWQRLVGGDDSAAAAVGDWIVAGGWAYVAGHMVTFVLKLGVDLAVAAFGSVPQLVGDFLFGLSPAEAGAGLLTNLIGAGFMGTIVLFVAGLGLVAAVVGVMWAFAVASGLSFVLAATGPVAGVVGVVPQMRWLRSLWLKALVLLALFPIGAGAVFKAAGMLPTMIVAGPVGAIIRLIWLWGAVGFLFAIAGVAGRVSLGTGAAVGMGTIRAGKAVVDLGAAAAVTGGVGAAALGAGALSSSGTTGATALPGAEGTAGGGISSGGGGLTGLLPPADRERIRAGRALENAEREQGAAMGAQALGLGRTAGLFRGRAHRSQLRARRHELNARTEQYLNSLQRSPPPPPPDDDGEAAPPPADSPKGRPPSPSGPPSHAPGGGPVPGSSSGGAAQAEETDTGQAPPPASESDDAAQAMQAYSLPAPARRQFAAGFRETGDDETEALRAVERLRRDLTAVSDDESTFHRFVNAGDEGARDVGRLAGAYQQFDSPASSRVPQSPDARLYEALGIVYGPKPDEFERDVPREINDILGGSRRS